MTPRTIWQALVALCAGLGGIVAAEVLVAWPDDGPMPRQAAQNIGVRLAKLNPDGLDGMVADILARPVFNPDRTAVEREEPEEDVAEERAAPQLQRRLTGVMLRSGVREALFQREGEKALAVKEGGEVDGWKVTSIEFDRVVLNSSAGEQILKPTTSSAAAAAVKTAPRAKISAPQQAKKAKPVRTAATNRAPSPPARSNGRP